MGEHLQDRYPLLSWGVGLVLAAFLVWGLLRARQVLRLSETELRAREEGWCTIGKNVAGGVAAFLGVSVLLGVTGAIGGFAFLRAGDVLALSTAALLPFFVEGLLQDASRGELHSPGLSVLLVALMFSVWALKLAEATATGLTLSGVSLVVGLPLVAAWWSWPWLGRPKPVLWSQLPLLALALFYPWRSLVTAVASIRAEGFAPFGVPRALHDLLGWAALLVGGYIARRALDRALILGENSAEFKIEEPPLRKEGT